MSQIFPGPLFSPRLLLRRLQCGDADALCSDRSLPDVARYQSWEAFGPDDAERLIQDQRDREPNIPGTWFQVAIVERETGTVVVDYRFRKTRLTFADQGAKSL